MFRPREIVEESLLKEEGPAFWSSSRSSRVFLSMLGTSEVGGRPRRSQRPVGALLEAAGCSMCDVAKNLVVKIGG